MIKTNTERVPEALETIPVTTVLWRVFFRLRYVPTYDGPFHVRRWFAAICGTGQLFYGSLLYNTRGARHTEVPWLYCNRKQCITYNIHFITHILCVRIIPNLTTVGSVSLFQSPVPWLYNNATENKEIICSARILVNDIILQPSSLQKQLNITRFDSL